MAQKTRTYFIDDLTGDEIPEEEAKTLRFSYDGVEYELDLSEESATKLNEAIQPFIGSARRVEGQPSAKSKGKVYTKGGPSLDEVRKWARENGYTVSDRGRVAATIVGAYNAAH